MILVCRFFAGARSVTKSPFISAPVTPFVLVPCSFYSSSFIFTYCYGGPGGAAVVRPSARADGMAQWSGALPSSTSMRLVCGGGLVPIAQPPKIKHLSSSQFPGCFVPYTEIQTYPMRFLAGVLAD